MRIFSDEMIMRWSTSVLVAVLFVLAPVGDSTAAQQSLNPYDRQVAEQVGKLKASSPHQRSAAAEALGYLRAFSSAPALVQAAGDTSPVVRREAVMSLGWCGGKKDVKVLLDKLGDTDWTVRQAAWVALTNITGMEFKFDALAKPDARVADIKVWRAWWAKFQSGQPDRPVDKPAPPPVAPTGDPNLALRGAVTASSMYKGPLSVLTDGATVGGYWQTKGVKFPQHCTVDLRKSRKFGCVVVQQYGSAFCMTDYSVDVSADGKTYKQIYRNKTRTARRLIVTFKPVEARWVRITSYGSVNRLYPTTFHEIGVYARTPPKAPPQPSRRAARDDLQVLALERKARSLGALGAPGDVAEIVRIVEPYRTTQSCSPAENSMVQVCLRSIGRLGGDEARKVLIAFLDNPRWARYAADALGDVGGKAAQAALIEAYPRFARSLSLRAPKVLPRDDRPGLDPRDRMYQTPYAIALSLSRMTITDPENLKALVAIAPLLLANMPSDYDGALLYQPEAYQPITAYLLEKAGLRQAACDAAFAYFGQARSVPDTPAGKTLASLAKKYAGDVPYAAIWLPTLCKDSKDVPVLIALLTHKNGWVRINAAKAIMFMGDKRGIASIAKLLKASKPEATFGYYGEYFNNKTQGHAEYNDPAPRWREAFVRALGRLGAVEHIGMLAEILQDDRNVLGVRHAVAVALDELGTDEALKVLERTEVDHPFYHIRLTAREALWKRGILKLRAHTPAPAKSIKTATGETSRAYSIVFIKGANKMPNRFQIDPWRQTYSTTDSGPTYRIGDNLHILRPDGTVTRLTNFTDGYVADCEVSWDGKRIIFAKRGGKDNPWWDVWEIGADGKGLRRITKGPYHDVQPAYLPNGRIVFSSSRIGMRDEYHGYPATGLTIMNADGSDMHFIGLNVGRDNEPSMLPDGRIVFSRLELFYSRLKTEITVHAINPDGTRDVTLYGPERRAFWRNVTRVNKEGWWGEVAPRHRVLRMTQPQSFDDGRIVCASTAGLTIIGPGRHRETVIPRYKNMAVTSPIPLDANTILCAATVRNASKPELGLYKMDVKTGVLTEVYNDPKTAEFEPRPIRPRPRPRTLAESRRTNSYTATLFCSSARISQEARTRNRGRLVRIVEGQPIVTRHETHINGKGPSWKNHVGTHARVLGTVPLAADGSFSLEVPADRLIHCQVLDSDRRVVGNQLIWMHARPGERRSCVGCHESPDATMLPTHRPQALRIAPVKCLPTGGEFSYRAKFWNKGTLSDEGEERTRTVRAVSLIGRQ
ncbi:MAG: HEAT repeat domain-containing protein [Phycisphaerae bacterium]|jgi:HEAT repeat protein|nr:HEAT repeat domain-containing protein [Phycisphaerae bacterium]